MDFLSFIDHFTLVHECGGISLRICQQDHSTMSAFFLCVSVVALFWSAWKIQGAYTGVHHQENSWLQLLHLWVHYNVVQVHCQSRWASRALQLGGVESKLPIMWLNIPIIINHKFQPTCCKQKTLTRALMPTCYVSCSPSSTSAFSRH